MGHKLENYILKEFIYSQECSYQDEMKLGIVAPLASFLRKSQILVLLNPTKLIEI